MVFFLAPLLAKGAMAATAAKGAATAAAATTAASGAAAAAAPAIAAAAPQASTVLGKTILQQVGGGVQDGMKAVNKVLAKPGEYVKQGKDWMGDQLGIGKDQNPKQETTWEPTVLNQVGPTQANPISPRDQRSTQLAEPTNVWY